MRFLLSITYLVHASLCVFPQSGNIEFSNVLHDFGVISENGGSVNYDFIFKNTGDLAVRIETVKASCSCTTPVWTLSEVNPGEFGFVKIKYAPKGRPGHFVKSIIVTASDGETQFKRYLNIKGKVISDDQAKVIEDFPLDEQKEKENELNKFLEDSEISTTVQVFPEDVKTIERVEQENKTSTEDELNALKASEEVISNAKLKSDSLITNLKKQAASDDQTENNKLKEQLKLQEEYLNLSRLEIQLLKEELTVMEKSDSLAREAIMSIQLELSARRKAQTKTEQEAKQLREKAKTIAVLEQEIDTLSTQLRDKEDAEEITKMIIEELLVELQVKETYDSIVQLKIAILEAELKLRKEAETLAIAEATRLSKQPKEKNNHTLITNEEILLMTKQFLAAKAKNQELETQLQIAQKAKRDVLVFAREMKAMAQSEINEKERLRALLRDINGQGKAQEIANHQIISKDRIKFQVQVAISKKPIPIKSKKFRGYKQITEYQVEDKYKYNIGNEQDLQSAVKLKEELKEAGFEFAFVVAYKNDERISLNDAALLTHNYTN